MAYDLKALRAAADDACEKAYKERRGMNDSVNWADLRCISAERCETDTGDTHYRVMLSEASPYADSFCAFIADRLCEAGFEGVEVMTEW